MMDDKQMMKDDMVAKLAMLLIDDGKASSMTEALDIVIIRVFHFLVPKSHKYLKINSKSIAHVNIYRYICTRKYNLTWHSEDR